MGSARLVHDLLRRSAERAPDATLLIHGADRASYGAVDAGSDRLAALLVAEGIRPGDRVGLLDENGRFWIESYYAVLKAGAIAVPLNTGADAGTLRTLLRDCGARALVLGRRHAATCAGWLPELPELRLAFVAEEGALLDAGRVTVRTPADAGASGAPPRIRRVDLDRAVILYTSGSTGRPKGAVLSHLNLVSNTRSIVAYLGLTPEDRVLDVLPFHYVYGKSLLNTHVSVGGSVVVENRFLYPQVAVDTLERERCTGFSGVPSTFAILLDKTNVAQRELPALRYVTQAGGAMAPALIRRVIETFPGRRVFIMYGATEASARLSYLPPEELPARIGSIGVAIPNVELRVLREDGSECGVGETGEIVARGSNVMEGYWNDPEETAKVLDRHGYHTGDLAVRDEDGFLRIVGRRREMIKSGAHRIAPKEIEEALLEHASVLEAAVIGVPHALLGESIRAYVVFRSGSAVGVESIAEFCRGRIATYKVPHEFVLRDSLPKNDSGKVMKEQLRAEGA